LLWLSGRKIWRQIKIGRLAKKRVEKTKQHSPIARPRRIQARMTGRCRGTRPQFAPGEEVFARARCRPGEITPMSSMNFRSRRGTVARAKNLFWQKLKRVRLGENELAQAKSHSSWTRNAFIGWKRERKGDLNLEKQEEKHRSDEIRAGAYGFSSYLPLLSFNGCHG